MKGLKIEKAKPSNVIDIYALLQEAQKEGILPGKPTPRELKSYYIRTLLQTVGGPGHIYFLAKRGRGYLGFVHAFIAASQWTGVASHVVVNYIYVVGKRRKNGIGKKLLDELKKEVQDLGIKRVEFSCPTIQAGDWSKSQGADSKRVIMEVDL